jgi:hypothetical protein
MAALVPISLLLAFGSVAAEYAYLDSNHDGYVSSGEHEVYARALFDEMDGQPGDDRLTVAEIMAHEATFVSHVFTTSNLLGPAEISTKEKIRRLDANQDGMVSQTEYTAGAAAWCQHRDLDNDGVLTLDEYDAGPPAPAAPAAPAAPPAPDEPPPEE